MAELGIGHSSPRDGGPAQITPLPASRMHNHGRVQEFRAYISEEASYFSAPRCVLFCRVWAASLLFSKYRASVESNCRLVIGGVDRTPTTLTERPLNADRASTERPGDEGAAMAEVGVWGLW